MERACRCTQIINRPRNLTAAIQPPFDSTVILIMPLREIYLTMCLWVLIFFLLNRLHDYILWHHRLLDEAELDQAEVNIMGRHDYHLI